MYIGCSDGLRGVRAGGKTDHVPLLVLLWLGSFMFTCLFFSRLSFPPFSSSFCLPIFFSPFLFFSRRCHLPIYPSESSDVPLPRRLIEDGDADEAVLWCYLDLCGWTWVVTMLDIKPTIFTKCDADESVR